MGLAAVNILNNFLKTSFAPVIIEKVNKRIFEHENKLTKKSNLSWCYRNCQDFALLAKRLDTALWEETLKFQQDLELRSNKILRELNLDLGGGGYYALLYFITRFFKPEIVLETGVAAGFSSQAFLKAMEINRQGLLYSSDFPYFRLKDPERYIGILVENGLKSRWNLYTKGDRVNLPEIVKKIPKIDIFHYDSDKTRSGRKFAMETVKNLLNKDSIIIMDDIQDNSFFQEYLRERSYFWRVFRFCDKYIGLISNNANFVP